jgi:hypothetical protein
MGVQPYGKGPLLWVGPLAARGQITVCGVPNGLKCVIFYTKYVIYKCGGGPRNVAWRAVGWRPVKVKCTLLQALRLCTGRTARRRSRGIALLIHGHGIRRGEGSVSRPGCSLPPGKTPYPLYRRLGGHQGRSGQERKISPPSGFDPWTVQPVASCHTDYATRPTWWQVVYFFYVSVCIEVTSNNLHSCYVTINK